MEFHFLGTGAGVPSKQRNVSAIGLRFLTRKKQDLWLFDCGEATQQQILHTPLKLPKLTKIFITHLHGDHIFGLPGLLGSRSFQGGTTPLTIYGPNGIKEFVHTTIKLSGTYLKYELNIIETEETFETVEENYRITAKKLEHGLPCLGYRIEEPEKPGRLLVEKLQNEGIKPGPHYEKIKHGNTVQLDDGRKINGKDYVSEPIQGRIITILGDTRPCQNSKELAINSDLLVHEATFHSNEKQHAHQFYHSTSLDAAQLANEANVRTLILTHISSRYQENENRLLEEARSHFPNTYLAQDFWSYHLTQEKS